MKVIKIVSLVLLTLAIGVSLATSVLVFASPTITTQECVCGIFAIVNTIVLSLCAVVLLRGNK